MVLPGFNFFLHPHLASEDCIVEVSILLRLWVLMYLLFHKFMFSFFFLLLLVNGYCIFVLFLYFCCFWAIF